MKYIMITTNTKIAYASDGITDADDSLKLKSEDVFMSHLAAYSEDDMFPAQALCPHLVLNGKNKVTHSTFLQRYHRHPIW